MSVPRVTPVHMFVGPTAHWLPRRLLNRLDVRVLPPAQRGSVSALVNANDSSGDIVLVDGRFGDVLAVGHRELLQALDAGWRVWGVASMGAIRAAELYPYGMVGHGRVYRHLVETMAPDDEVAVLHGPAPDYGPITEALIDLREFLVCLVEGERLTAWHAAQVEQRLAGMWFGARTLAVMCELIEDVAGTATADTVVAQLPELMRRRVKTADLEMFLREEPWTRPVP